MTPIIEQHDGIFVVRDDLFPGGTKARYFNQLFANHDHIVYASPSCGGAQVALAHAAKKHGKTVHLFVTSRKQLHKRTLQAKALGAKIHLCADKNGGCVRLNVCISRARQFAHQKGYKLLSLGGASQDMETAITKAAKTLGQNWDEVWCAAGSGTLLKALTKAFPKAVIHGVEVAAPLSGDFQRQAILHKFPKKKLGDPFKVEAPFPSCAHYDRKAWYICHQHQQQGTHRATKRILFWNVFGN